ncbi:MAG: hypothetical protein ACFFFD_09400 [Promethearchaeota archaeon]
MNRRSVQIRAVLLVGVFLALALVGTSPMILGRGTDGGGGGYIWDSAVAYSDESFSAVAYRTGQIFAHKDDPGEYGRVDAHLKRNYIAPDDGFIQILIGYQWNWYTDAFRWVYLGSAGLKNPLGHYETLMLTLIDPADYSQGHEASDYQSYTQTYMTTWTYITYIPVIEGVKYTLQFDLVIVSLIDADEFHRISIPQSDASFFVRNTILFYYSIP